MSSTPEKQPAPPAIVDRTGVFCIIGAGSSGLVAAKSLLAVSIPCEVFEREDGIGGNWYYGRPNSSICRSTHLISSKPLTEYPDFPMPASYPDFPSHQQVMAYFKDYAAHFDLERVITFNTEVTRVAPADATATAWDVSLRDLATGAEQTRRYRGVIICNGHNWLPKIPQYPGEFTGKTLHSADYKTPDVLEGQRVLVVGAGNSGCDIASESATHANKTFLSTRRGYYYMPKYFLGRPIDQIGERMLDLGAPLGLRRLIGAITYRVAVGDLGRYGVQRPDHKLFETHPIVNNQLPYYIAHGDVITKPDIQRFDGPRVTFTDATTEEIDLLVYATGFQIVFPFMDRDLLNWTRDHPSLYLNVFHPTYDNLFVVGLIQPDSGQWGLADRQARAIARFVTQLDRHSPKAERFRRLKRAGQENYGGGVHYKESTRHYVEVEHHSYRKRLDAAAAQLA